MKSFVFSLLVLPALTHAADWKAVAKTPATIAVVNMQPGPLAISANADDKNGWTHVPPQLTSNGATIFTPSGNTNGLADIEIKTDGYMLIACNWDYQGNQSGDWDKDAWDERKFKTKGWDRLTKGELGGELIKNGNRVQTVFMKKVKKGDKFRLRCNKYDPPFPILLSSKP